MCACEKCNLCHNYRSVAIMHGYTTIAAKIRYKSLIIFFNTKFVVVLSELYMIVEDETCYQEKTLWRIEDWSKTIEYTVL